MALLDMIFKRNSRAHRAQEYLTAAGIYISGDESLTQLEALLVANSLRTLTQLALPPNSFITPPSFTAGSAPPNTLGFDGDTAYDPTLKKIYAPKAAGAWPAGTLLAAASSSVGVFGDSSDGACVLDGAAAFTTFATRSGSVYTMTADCNCTNLTINAGVTLIPNGCKILVSGTLTNNGTIGSVAAAGTSAGVGGAAFTFGSVVGGSGGSAGATAVGIAGVSGTVGVSGAGGAGVSAGGGAAAGVLTLTAKLRMILSQAAVLGSGVYCYGATTARVLAGGSSGAGGGGDGTNKGGGGGAAGQCIAIAAKTFVNAGTIVATGGAGGTPTTGNAGGGGGGSGGLVYVLSLNAVTIGTTDVTGGAAGSGVGTGVAGGAGGAGAVFTEVIS